jgi:hypothetical protein
MPRTKTLPPAHIKKTPTVSGTVRAQKHANPVLLPSLTLISLSKTGRVKIVCREVELAASRRKRGRGRKK